jgi:hypothetical protein
MSISFDYSQAIRVNQSKKGQARAHLNIIFNRSMCFYRFCQFAGLLAVAGLARVLFSLPLLGETIRRWRVSRYLHNTRQQQQQLRLKTFIPFGSRTKVGRKGPRAAHHHHHHPDSCTSREMYTHTQLLKRTEITDVIFFLPKKIPTFFSFFF